MAELITSDSTGAKTVRALLTALFAAICAASGLWTMPPLDRDESRFAQASAQMLESGDFINIRFQDAERNKKPAGIYWMQAASVASFSSAEAREIWAYRLPSVLGAALAAIFTYCAGARLYGPIVGLIAAMLLATAPALAAEGAIAKTDAMLLACVTGAQAALIQIYARFRASEENGWAWPLAFWIALGAGVLIKGPIIVLIVGLTALAVSVRENGLRWLSGFRPLVGILILVLMIAPWATAIAIATEGRFFADAVGGDMASKISGVQESHGGPPGYYLIVVWVLFWPAAAVILPALRQAYATRKAWPSFVLLAWLAPSWLVFELTATKLPHYTLPLYPALAILAARSIASGAGRRWSFTRKAGVLIYVGVGAAIGGLIPWLSANYGGHSLEAFSAAAGASIALSALGAGLLFWRAKCLSAAAIASATSLMLAYILLNGLLPRLDDLRLSPRLDLALQQENIHPIRNGAPPAAVAGYAEPSAVFLLGTDLVLTDGKGAADHLHNFPGAAIIVEDRQSEGFLAQAEANGDNPVQISRIEGLNYSNGKRTALTVYRSPITSNLPAQ